MLVDRQRHTHTPDSAERRRRIAKATRFEPRSTSASIASPTPGPSTTTSTLPSSTQYLPLADCAKASRKHTVDGYLQVGCLAITPVRHALASARDLPRTARVPYPLPRDARALCDTARTVPSNGPGSAHSARPVACPVAQGRPLPISPSQLAGPRREPLRIRDSRSSLCIGPRQLARATVDELPPLPGPTINTHIAGGHRAQRGKNKRARKPQRSVGPAPVSQTDRHREGEPRCSCSLPPTTP